jgi:hypothetical protein
LAEIGEAKAMAKQTNAAQVVASFLSEMETVSSFKKKRKK